jgi:hypothetical protein
VSCAKKCHHAQPEVSINYRNLMKVASSIFSVLCRSVEKAANEKQDGDKMSLSEIADDHI